MVYDKIDNWKQYAGISNNIRLGLEFLSKADADLAWGVHELSPRGAGYCVGVRY